jgi:hypothetical protein
MHGAYMIIFFNSEPYCQAKWFKMARHLQMTNKTGLYVRAEVVRQFTCYRRLPQNFNLPARKLFSEAFSLIFSTNRIIPALIKKCYYV